MMSMLQNGDCLDEMRDLADGCVDSIVTDPPYGLNFMGKDFDNPKMMGQAVVMHGGLQRYPKGEKRTGYADCDMLMFQDYMTPIFAEALRVAKPGAHLLAFGGTRTYHRLACAIEDAGWEVRDCIMWVYGSGFPKSMDVAKAIDKMLGAERTEVIGSRHRNVKPYDDGNGWNANNTTGDYQYMAPATPEASAWQGFGTCLKPAVEPIVVARKPLDGTVAANVLKYGTGAINIDGCRVPTDSPVIVHSPAKKTLLDSGHKDLGTWENNKGRFPANLIHDGSDEVLALFPDTGKSTGGRTIKRSGGGNVGSGKKSEASWSNDDPGFGDSGSAARFFYCAKASRKERDAGLDGLPLMSNMRVNAPRSCEQEKTKSRYANNHPTVKPLALMRYLVRLVTRKGGIVLDPFMGSGTTGVAAIQEGMHFVGIELDPHYYEIASERIRKAKPIEQKPKDTQMELPL